MLQSAPSKISASRSWRASLLGPRLVITNTGTQISSDGRSTGHKRPASTSGAGILTKQTGGTLTLAGPLLTVAANTTVSNAVIRPAASLTPGATWKWSGRSRDVHMEIESHFEGMETITVPAGTFRTIVVQPVIQTRGLFSEGGRAEVYFTDDDRRLLILNL